jgi:cob(I)alamin adenosyltransferase
MKIYTKTGDKGSTSLVGGSRVSKNHPRVHAYGTVDELISNLSLLRAEFSKDNFSTDLRRIQSTLMLAAAHLASDHQTDKLKEFDPEETVYLEKEIDKMQSELPAQTAFIIPGGNKASSICHVCRTVCRRAERSSIAIGEDEKLEIVIKYLNRLSDYLFVLARYISFKCGIADDFWHQ